MNLRSGRVELTRAIEDPLVELAAYAEKNIKKQIFIWNSKRFKKF